MVLQHNSSKITSKDRSIVTSILQIIEVLSKFSDHYEKKLNFESLATSLKLSATEMDEIIGIILSFQDLFNTVFKEFRLRKRIQKNSLYLIAETTSPLKQIPAKIIMTHTHVKLLNDLIYLFKFVKRGTGFNVGSNTPEFLQKVKELCSYYPYLFKQEKGILYPTVFGLQLGELILSYTKTNKKISMLELNDHTIRVIEDE